MTVFVDLPAMRPARLAEGVATADLGERVRALRAWVRGARVESLRDGVRLVVTLDLPTIARFAETVRSEADSLPFWHFRLLANAPTCWLEVTADAPADALARAIFAELAADVG